MITVYSDDHRLQHGKAELHGNKLVPCFEKPERADMVLDRIRQRKLGCVIAPEGFGLAPFQRVHSAEYIAFLQNAWADWLAAGGDGDALPPCTPMPDMSRRVPRSIWGRISYYSFDASAPLTGGTWAAAKASANVALTGQNLITGGEKSAFALCRPPGHHASTSYYGGYCFLNNAAIAAQAFRDAGASRVAILDVDYHHGNGTQSIFYDRDDVFFLSLHGDPEEDYPFFLGHADETGRGRGEGYNANYPLPHGTGAETWFDVLDQAIRRIKAYKPDALVVSLGVDTYEGDPISHFKLKSDDFLTMGRRLAQPGLPTLFVMEGGYAVEDLGINAVNVLEGFEQQSI